MLSQLTRSADRLTRKFIRLDTGRLSGSTPIATGSTWTVLAAGSAGLPATVNHSVCDCNCHCADGCDWVGVPGSASLGADAIAAIDAVAIAVTIAIAIAIAIDIPTLDATQNLISSPHIKTLKTSCQAVAMPPSTAVRCAASSATMASAERPNR